MLSTVALCVCTQTNSSQRRIRDSMKQGHLNWPLCKQKEGDTQGYEGCKVTWNADQMPRADYAILGLRTESKMAFWWAVSSSKNYWPTHKLCLLGSTWNAPLQSKVTKPAQHCWAGPAPDGQREFFLCIKMTAKTSVEFILFAQTSVQWRKCEKSAQM